MSFISGDGDVKAGEAMPGEPGTEDEYDVQFKLLVVGESAVGKSCLLRQFTDKAFDDTFTSTIGVDFKHRKIELQEGEFAGTKLKLQIWDTAGQERFRTVNSSYYKGAHGVLVVFSLTDKASFDKCSEWVDEIQKHGQEADFMFIANKSDLASDRQVTEEEAKKFAWLYKKEVVETSAKNNVNVEAAFLNLTEQILRKRKKQDEEAAAAAAAAAKNSPKSMSGEQKKGDEGCCTIL